jgi:hypothetical protein
MCCLQAIPSSDHVLKHHNSQRMIHACYVMQDSSVGACITSTTGFARFAVRHGRTTEARTRTTQPLPCVFYPGARQRAHDAFLLGKDL